MCRAWKIVMAAFLLYCVCLPHANGEDTTKSEIRQVFDALGRYSLCLERVLPKDPSCGNPWPRTRFLDDVPWPTLRAEMIEVLKSGPREAVMGVCLVYGRQLMQRKLEPDPEIYVLLLTRIRQDSLESAAYNAAITAALGLYEKPETLVAFMEAAGRATLPRERFGFIKGTAVSLGISLGIDERPYFSRGVQTGGSESGSVVLARNEVVLSSFERWFWEIRDKIRVNRKGIFYIDGGNSFAGGDELSKEDRERVRQDPECVLRLTSVIFEEGDVPQKMVPELEKCGVALLGAKGAKIAEGLRKNRSIESGGGEHPAPWTAVLESRYPMMDAVLLAAAYVAAYSEDDKALELARKMLTAVGPSDLPRVLKGEPKEVRRKAEQFAGTVE